MRPKLVMEVIFRKEIEQAEGKQLAMEQEVGEYREKCVNPNTQAERGYIDEVLISCRTRQKLITAVHFVEKSRVQFAEEPW
jgi:acetyl-CoA carboxylase carboxyltransferase component